MNNQLMNFKGNDVEVLIIDGKTHFNPYHVGNCLDLTKSAVRKSIGNMNNNQVIKLKNSDVKDGNIRKLNNAGENFLTESGVYKLVFRSNKDEAREFENWVTDEVLPSIRQTGSYSVEQYDNDINEYDMLRGMIDKLEETDKKANKALNKSDKLEHRVDNLDNINIEGNLKDRLNAMIKKYAHDKGKPYGVAYGEFYKRYNRTYNTNVKLRVTNYEKRTGNDITVPKLLQKENELEDAIRVLDKMLN